MTAGTGTVKRYAEKGEGEGEGGSNFKAEAVTRYRSLLANGLFRRLKAAAANLPALADSVGRYLKHAV
jgi:hypothetical protein